MTVKGCRPSKVYQRYFDKINLLYFEGKLPPTKVLVAPLLKITQLSQKDAQKKSASGNWKDAGYYGLCGVDDKGETCLILDKGTAVFHPIITKQTVLHEAIHLRLTAYKGHGKPFKKEIRRIAALGALDDLL